jgi:hypothetical protein
MPASSAIYWVRLLAVPFFMKTVCAASKIRSRVSMSGSGTGVLDRTVELCGLTMWLR